MNDTAFYQRINLLDDDDVVDVEPAPAAPLPDNGLARVSWPIRVMATALPFVIVPAQFYLLGAWIEHGHGINVWFALALALTMGSLVACLLMLYGAWWRR